MANVLKKDPVIYERERDSFIRDLKHFYETRGAPFRKLPHINGKQVDLYLLYVLVTSKGGWLKVNQRNEWGNILDQFTTLKFCVNGEVALKQVYLRYLDKYEKIHFLGETGHQVSEEDEDSKHRRWPKSSHFTTVSFSQQQQTTADNSRSSTTATTQVKSTDYDKLALSLISPLPNEQDFAINICSLLCGGTTDNDADSAIVDSKISSADFKLYEHPILVNYLLAHAAVFDHPALRAIMEDCYREVRKHSMKHFWSTILLDKELSVLMDEKKFVKQRLKRERLKRNTNNNRSSTVRKFTNDYVSSDTDENDESGVVPMSLCSREEGLDGARLKIEPEDLELFCLGRGSGVEDWFGQRVLQIATILRNATFMEENVPTLAANVTFIRFVLLCCGSRWSCIHQLGYDMLTNIASKIILDDSILEHVLRIISAGLESPDRAVVLACVEALNKFGQNEQNEDIILRSIEQKIYDRICVFLSLQDIMLLIQTLECLYSLTSLGERPCNAIVHINGVIHTLVSLVTIEAQSYGPKACILMRVVETMIPSDESKEPVESPVVVVTQRQQQNLQATPLQQVQPKPCISQTQPSQLQQLIQKPISTSQQPPISLQPHAKLVEQDSGKLLLPQLQPQPLQLQQQQPQQNTIHLVHSNQQQNNSVLPSHQNLSNVLPTTGSIACAMSPVASTATNKITKQQIVPSNCPPTSSTSAASIIMTSSVSTTSSVVVSSSTATLSSPENVNATDTSSANNNTSLIKSLLASKVGDLIGMNSSNLLKSDNCLITTAQQSSHQIVITKPTLSAMQVTQRQQQHLQQVTPVQQIQSKPCVSQAQTSQLQQLIQKPISTSGQQQSTTPLQPHQKHVDQDAGKLLLPQMPQQPQQNVIQAVHPNQQQHSQLQQQNSIIKQPQITLPTTQNQQCTSSQTQTSQLQLQLIQKPVVPSSIQQQSASVQTSSGQQQQQVEQDSSKLLLPQFQQQQVIVQSSTQQPQSNQFQQQQQQSAQPVSTLLVQNQQPQKQHQPVTMYKSASSQSVISCIDATDKILPQICQQQLPITTQKKVDVAVSAKQLPMSLTDQIRQLLSNQKPQPSQLSQLLTQPVISKSVQQLQQPQQQQFQIQQNTQTKQSVGQQTQPQHTHFVAARQTQNSQVQTQKESPAKMVPVITSSAGVQAGSGLKPFLSRINGIRGIQIIGDKSEDRDAENNIVGTDGNSSEVFGNYLINGYAGGIKADESMLNNPLPNNMLTEESLLNTIMMEDALASNLIGEDALLNNISIDNIDFNISNTASNTVTATMTGVKTEGNVVNNTENYASTGVDPLASSVKPEVTAVANFNLPNSDFLNNASTTTVVGGTIINRNAISDNKKLIAVPAVSTNYLNSGGIAGQIVKVATAGDNKMKITLNEQPTSIISSSIASTPATKSFMLAKLLEKSGDRRDAPILNGALRIGENGLELITKDSLDKCSVKTLSSPQDKSVICSGRRITQTYSRAANAAANNALRKQTENTKAANTTNIGKCHQGVSGQFNNERVVVGVKRTVDQEVQCDEVPPLKKFHLNGDSNLSSSTNDDDTQDESNVKASSSAANLYAALAADVLEGDTDEDEVPSTSSSQTQTQTQQLPNQISQQTQSSLSIQTQRLPLQQQAQHLQQQQQTVIVEQPQQLYLSPGPGNASRQILALTSPAGAFSSLMSAAGQPIIVSPQTAIIQGQPQTVLVTQTPQHGSATKTIIILSQNAPQLSVPPSSSSPSSQPSKVIIQKSATPPLTTSAAASVSSQVSANSKNTYQQKNIVTTSVACGQAVKICQSTQAISSTSVSSSSSSSVTHSSQFVQTMQQSNSQYNRGTPTPSLPHLINSPQVSVSNPQTVTSLATSVMTNTAKNSNVSSKTVNTVPIVNVPQSNANVIAAQTPTVIQSTSNNTSSQQQNVTNVRHFAGTSSQNNNNQNRIHQTSAEVITSSQPSTSTVGLAGPSKPSNTPSHAFSTTICQTVTTNTITITKHSGTVPPTNATPAARQHVKVIKNNTPPTQPVRSTIHRMHSDSHGQFICEWRGCMRSFKTPNEVYLHSCAAHCPTGSQEIQCLWERCDTMKRRRFSLMTHLYDRHCNPETLRMMSVRRRQISQSGKSEIPPPSPPAPHPGYAPNAAYQAIRRHALEFVNPRELQDENEGPVTKSIRLTSSLILRNLVIYSSAGRRCLSGYEPQLASVALSNVESSRAIAHILYDMNNHDR